jgi:diguanylate cyclase (GGDEF)-like protein/PAS domain S-box-containing protein
MANINLEDMVHERTDQLTQARDELSEYINVIDKYIITSSTDKYGVITKTSSAFCRISQYEENELIGQAHNIVRHEDMPVSTYEDMWGTIKQGWAWRGEIKNKAKDGSAYWVDVNIEPKLNKNGEIIGYTAIRQDITDKKRVEELAVTDPLTKLFNRLKLNDVLNHEVERISRYPKDLSVILLDVDHFKHVNDNYGHHTGDSVLVSIAEIVTSRARDTDVIGRWGGEEFLIICIETNIIGAEQLANDVRLAISSYDFGECGHITSSFGVAAFNKDESIESLLRRSDEALYQAKDAGRNRVVVDN